MKEILLSLKDREVATLQRLIDNVQRTRRARGRTQDEETQFFYWLQSKITSNPFTPDDDAIESEFEIYMRNPIVIEDLRQQNQQQLEEGQLSALLQRRNTLNRRIERWNARVDGIPEKPYKATVNELSSINDRIRAARGYARVDKNQLGTQMLKKK
jgi:hypothetical protein